MHPTALPDAISAPVAVPVRELDRKVASSLLWQAGKVGIQMAQYVVLARLVAPAEYGKFALAAPLFAVLGVINDGGLSTAAVTGKRYDARLAANLYWAQLGLGGGAAVVMALGAPVLAWLFGVPELLSIGLWLAVSLFVSAWALQPKAALRRDLRIGQLVFVDIFGVAAGLIAAWMAAGPTSGVALLVIAQVVNAAAGSAVAVALAPVQLRAWGRNSGLRHALQVGWHMVGSDLLNVLRVQCPAFIIGFFVLLADVGLFNRANQLLNVPLAVLGPAMANFLLPVLVRTRDRPEEYRRNVQRTLRLFLAAAIPVSVWIAVGPADLIGAVLGDAWRPVVPVLRYLSPLFASQVVSTVALVSLLGVERSRTVRLFSFWNLAVTVMVVLAAAPFGIGAVAIALAVSGVALRAPLLVGLAVTEGSIVLADVLAGLRLMLGLALAAAAALALCRLLPLSGLAVDVLGLGIVGAITAAALAASLRRPQTTAGGVR